MIIDRITEPNYLLPLLLIISIYLFFIKKDKNNAIILASSTILTGILIKVLKLLIAKPRPLNPLVDATSYSFPSGHATTIIFFLGILIYLFSKESSRKTYILVSIPIIILVAISRIYLNVHFISDVLGGLILGCLILIFTIHLDKILFKSRSV